MANIESHRRCRICDRPIPAKRAAIYPQAVLCGKDACAVQNHKRAERAKQKRWRDKRSAADPGFRLRHLQACRDRYVRRRLAAGKKPAEREPVAIPRGRLDTYLSSIRQGTAGALRRAARAFGAVCGLAVDNATERTNRQGLRPES